MPPPGIQISKAGIVFIILFTAGSLCYFLSMMKSPPPVDMRMLLIASIEFAERGGDQVRQVMESKKLGTLSKGRTNEGANDPLTRGDLLSHRAITESLKRSFKYVTIVSEEKDSSRASDEYINPAPISNTEVDRLIKDPFVSVDPSDVLVWVDPLDATQEYTEELLEYVTTMVCVAVKGYPTIGVIHKPFEKKTYWTWVGHGSNVVDHSSSAPKYSIIMSRSHTGDANKTIHKAFGKDVKVIPAGGAGYKSLALFNGKASAYLHTTLIKKWDICAGNALLDHAGGKMTTRAGERIDYSSGNSPKNKGGLVAALHDHEFYRTKLQQT